jgi:ribosomal protein L7/L12
VSKLIEELTDLSPEQARRLVDYAPNDVLDADPSIAEQVKTLFEKEGATVTLTPFQQIEHGR